MENVRMLSDQAMVRLKKLLDVHAARQRVAAKNLSNADTEAYEPKKVEFTDELAKAVGKVRMTRTREGHLSSRRVRQAERGYVEVVDEEAVSNPDTRLERTTVELADAEMAYAVAAKLMAKRGATIKTAVSGQF